LPDVRLQDRGLGPFRPQSEPDRRGRSGGRASGLGSVPCLAAGGAATPSLAGRGDPNGARRSMRIRQHVNPLKSDLLEIAEVPRVEAEPGRALDVELGAAEAHFLLDLAREDPATSFVGVEIRRELVEAVNA